MNILKSKGRSIYLLGSLIFATLFPLSKFLESQASSLCPVIGSYYYETLCRLIGDISFIAVPLFIFSLLFLFSGNEKVFLSWKRFTVIYLPLYLALAIFTPWYVGDGFMNLQKELVIFIFCGVYFALSAFLVLYKSHKLCSVE